MVLEWSSLAKSPVLSGRYTCIVINRYSISHLISLDVAETGYYPFIHSVINGSHIAMACSNDP